jgi:hypothetical protein
MIYYYKNSGKIFCHAHDVEMIHGVSKVRDLNILVQGRKTELLYYCPECEREILGEVLFK